MLSPSHSLYACLKNGRTQRPYKNGIIVCQSLLSHHIPRWLVFSYYLNSVHLPHLTETVWAPFYQNLNEEFADSSLALELFLWLQLKSIYFFPRCPKIYLLIIWKTEVQRKREIDWLIFHLMINFPKWLQQLGLNRGASLPGLPCGWQGPSVWAIFHWFPRLISRRWIS